MGKFLIGGANRDTTQRKKSRNIYIEREKGAAMDMEGFGKGEAGKGKAKGGASDSYSEQRRSY